MDSGGGRKSSSPQIKYFTARMKPFEGHSSIKDRQEIYRKALSTLPRVEIIEGHCLQKKTRTLLVVAPPTGSREVTIIRNEEKQSDVNLACHLLLDACKGRYDAAIVISGDGDFSTPKRMARSEFAKRVVVLNPQRRSSYHLCQVAPACRGTHYRFDGWTGRETRTRNDGIRAGLLRASQFPQTLDLSGGSAISRPAT